VNSLAAIASFPLCNSRSSTKAACASARRFTIRSAYSWSTRPASVNCPSRDERSKSGSPMSCSSLRIDWLTADWVRNSFSAARENFRSRATARNTSSCDRSMLFPQAKLNEASAPLMSFIYSNDEDRIISFASTLGHLSITGPSAEVFGNATSAHHNFRYHLAGRRAVARVQHEHE